MLWIGSAFLSNAIRRTGSIACRLKKCFVFWIVRCYQWCVCMGLYVGGTDHCPVNACMQFSWCLYSDKDCRIMCLNLNSFMIFDWGLFCRSQRVVVSVLRWRLSSILWLKRQSPVRFEVHSGTSAWFECKLAFKLPDNCDKMCYSMVHILTLGYDGDRWMFIL